MDLENLLWMLTALAGVVVLLTWMRMKSTAARSGHAVIPQGIVTSHTFFGVLALGTWVYFLIDRTTTVGYAAIGLWWIVVILGLLILLRWLPGSGGRAVETQDDSWADGPALSILGHVGLLLGTGFFTYVVLTEQLL